MQLPWCARQEGIHTYYSNLLRFHCEGLREPLTHCRSARVCSPRRTGHALFKVNPKDVNPGIPLAHTPFGRGGGHWQESSKADSEMAGVGKVVENLKSTKLVNGGRRRDLRPGEGRTGESALCFTGHSAREDNYREFLVGKYLVYWLVPANGA